MASDWALVKEYVKAEFKDYLPVPTIADLHQYQPLNFLILRNGDSFELKWYEKPLGLFSKPSPRFVSVGEIDNFAASNLLEDGSFISLPETRVKNLCILGEDAKTKTVLEGQAAKDPPENAEASIKTTTVLPCLGVISRHSVTYRDLRKWIEQYCFLESDDMILQAKRGNLFIIHDVIMAEKLSSKGKSKQSLSGRFFSYLEFNFKSRSSMDLKRPSEFGHFPIAFKIGKIKVRRSKHAAHAPAMTRPTDGSNPTSPTTTRSSWRLKIEPLKDFSESSLRRKFGKENSPSSGK